MVNVNNVKVIFINEKGKINFNVEGEIAPIEELEYQAMSNGFIIQGDFLCAEGFYRNMSFDPLAAEYVLIESYPDIEREFKINIDEFEEIISLKETSSDLLIATTRMFRDDIIYTYMLSRQEDNSIKWNKTFIYKDMVC